MQPHELLILDKMDKIKKQLDKIEENQEKLDEKLSKHIHEFSKEEINQMYMEKGI